MDNMKRDSRILVTGHRGLVGSALVRALNAQGFTNILTWTREEVDLCDPLRVWDAFMAHDPEYVFHCAAKVGGIVGNRDHPLEFLLDNLHMTLNVLGNCSRNTTKVLFFGSACAYPKFALVPVKETSLLTGEMESSNLNYALAKIVGIKLCQAYSGRVPCRFLSAMPTNLYGLGDNYHPTDSHVIPGMIRRFHTAKTTNAPEVVLWGSGTPLRDFLFSDDLAEAAILLMKNHDDPDPVNIASGHAVSLRVLAANIASVVGYSGDIRWDTSKPDGTPDRTMDVTKLKSIIPWVPRTPLFHGLARAYHDFCHR